MKNVVDVVLGGLTYWAFGYGLSYGDSPLSNSFFALGTVAGGTWFVDATGPDMGPVFVTFLFQLSFATTATTIVSGAIAERCGYAELRDAGWPICWRTWVGMTLISAVPPSAWLCPGWWEFGRSS